MGIPEGIIFSCNIIIGIICAGNQISDNAAFAVIWKYLDCICCCCGGFCNKQQKKAFVVFIFQIYQGLKSAPMFYLPLNKLFLMERRKLSDL